MRYLNKKEEGLRPWTLNIAVYPILNRVLAEKKMSVVLARNNFKYGSQEFKWSGFFLPIIAK